MGYIEELRKIVGTRPLILAGVGVAVIDDYGRILLQKRRDGLWGSPRRLAGARRVNRKSGAAGSVGRNGAGDR
ncbi:hypothetical protein LR69_02514 [Geobacillus sp. BCO2]|nr:hypothetical protein LR69_02514 [Geobacillus sp. BCO2]